MLNIRFFKKSGKSVKKKCLKSDSHALSWQFLREKCATQHCWPQPRLVGYQLTTICSSDITASSLDVTIFDFKEKCQKWAPKNILKTSQQTAR